MCACVCVCVVHGHVRCVTQLRVVGTLDLDQTLMVRAEYIIFTTHNVIMTMTYNCNFVHNLACNQSFVT